MRKRLKGLRALHDRVPARSGKVRNLGRPASGFRVKNSRAASTASAKRVANAIASTGSRSVSNKYQRNCASTSASKGSDRRIVIAASVVERDLTACAYRLCGVECEDCLDPDVSRQ